MRFFRKHKHTILCMLLLIVVIVFFGLWLELGGKNVGVEEYVWHSTLEPEYIEFDGQKYVKNQKVETILVCGVDKDGKIDLSGPNQTGGEVDMLMLLVVNNNTGTIDKIQINRDTMTQINILNDNYYTEGTATAQIALSHAYGNGNSISSKNTVDAVENLFYGIDIDKYLFVNMGAIPVVNDYFGGVEVLIEDDFSEVDSSLKMGEIIKLNGEQAYNFLRARKNISDGTNENRMKRHRHYIDSLIEVIYDSTEDGEKNASNLYNKIYDYMNTSLSASEITALVIKTKDYIRNDIVVLEGRFNNESNLAEFYPDEEKLRKLVVDLFYVPQEINS